jgi:hypothetical protein
MPGTVLFARTKKLPKKPATAAKSAFALNQGKMEYLPLRRNIPKIVSAMLAEVTPQTPTQRTTLWQS